MAKLLAVNWRDIRDPDGGGAEVHLHQILTRMVAKGHEVTWLSCRYPGSLETETYDGIRVIRRGNWFSANYTMPFAVQSYLRRYPQDLVIDDINKIPFFLPAFTRTRVLAVVPHLFGSTVFRETNALFGTYVWLWERLIPWVYRKSRFAVISPSTRDDLVARGVPPESIDVVLCGLDHSVFRRIDGVQRYAEPTIVHFGRVRKYKSIDVVLRAFVRIRRELPGARLLVIGDGPERPALERLAQGLALGESARFLGSAKTEELVTILNRAHLFLNASPKEGWGLTVVEANACGMPVVGSNRPGLRDSIKDGVTGYVVPYGDDAAFAEKALLLLRDSERWRTMSDAGVAWARSLTWDRTADDMERVFFSVIGSSREGRS